MLAFSFQIVSFYMFLLENDIFPLAVFLVKTACNSHLWLQYIEYTFMSVHLPFWLSLGLVAIKCNKKPFSSFVLAPWWSSSIFSTVVLLLHLTEIKLLVLSLRNTFSSKQIPFSHPHSGSLWAEHSFPFTKVLLLRNIHVLHPSPIKQASQPALYSSQNGQWTSDSWGFWWSGGIWFCDDIS